MTSEFAGLALMFDDEPDGAFLELMQEGAVDANWTYIGFDKAHDALEHFDDSIGALITGLGKAQMFSPHLPADRLIERSDKLEIPRVIVSSHANANRYVRRGSSDLLIVKHVELEEIPAKLSAWLLSLTQQA